MDNVLKQVFNGKYINESIKETMGNQEKSGEEEVF
jgi:hypothetical protein